MIVKLLTEQHLEFLSLKGDYRGSSESTLVKLSSCWKSHATAHLKIQRFCLIFNHSFLSSCQTKSTYHRRHYHILLAIYSFYTVYVKVDTANI